MHVGRAAGAAAPGRRVVCARPSVSKTRTRCGLLALPALDCELGRLAMARSFGSSSAIWVALSPNAISLELKQQSPQQQNFNLLTINIDADRADLIRRNRSSRDRPANLVMIQPDQVAFHQLVCFENQTRTTVT